MGRSISNISGSITHHIFGEELLLLPDKALYLPHYDILVISDVHLGKITHFRKNGIGLPQSAMYDNIDRITLLVDSIEPSIVIFLGDLFHSSFNGEWMMLKDFISGRSETQFILTTGNHDILDPSIYAQSGLESVDAYQIGKLIFTHEPLTAIPSGHYNIYGHIHPAIKMIGDGRQRLRLACFYFEKNHAILPAFGTFTGMHNQKPKQGADIYVIAENSVIKVNS